MRRKQSLFFIALFLTTTYSCKKRNDVNAMLSTFLVEQQVQFQDYDFIHVLTENGCPSCNEYYYNYLIKNASSERQLIVLAAQGTMIDISQMLLREKGIVKVSNQYLWKQPFDSSRVFILNEGAIDSVVTFTPKRIINQIGALLRMTNSRKK